MKPIERKRLKGMDYCKLVDDFSFEESGYKRGNKYWKASTLYDYVKNKKIKPFKYPIACFDLSVKYTQFDNEDTYNVVYQIKRVINANPDIPIILDDLGQIADGVHRIFKAFCEDRKYIMAYRLTEMPNPDEISKEE